jgi:hypothetical protein
MIEWASGVQPLTAQNKSISLSSAMNLLGGAFHLFAGQSVPISAATPAEETNTILFWRIIIARRRLVFTNCGSRGQLDGHFGQVPPSRFQLAKLT